MLKSLRNAGSSRRKGAAILAAGLIALGLWQVGQAGYIHLKAGLAQVLIQNAWAETLEGGTRVRPWPWADTWPVARLQFPDLDIDLMVLAGANGRNLAFGPAHMEGTASPGSLGHSILGGHRDTHFSFLREVEDGSEIRVQTPDGSWRRYRVTDRQVIDARYARLAAGTGEAALTLVTCYPFESVLPGGPLRYLVSAYEPQESDWPPPAEATVENSNSSVSAQLRGDF